MQHANHANKTHAHAGTLLLLLLLCGEAHATCTMPRPTAHHISLGVQCPKANIIVIMLQGQSVTRRMSEGLVNRLNAGMRTCAQCAKTNMYTLTCACCTHAPITEESECLSLESPNVSLSLSVRDVSSNHGFRTLRTITTGCCANS